MPGSDLPHEAEEGKLFGDHEQYENAEADVKGRNNSRGGTAGSGTAAQRATSPDETLQGQSRGGTAGSDSRPRSSRTPGTPSRRKSTGTPSPTRDIPGSRGNSNHRQNSSGSPTRTSSGGGEFSINLTVEEKKKLRQQAEHEKKEAKKRQKQEEVDKILAEQAVKEREIAFEDLERAVAINTTWGEILRCHIILMGYVSISGDRNLEEASKFRVEDEEDAADDPEEPDGILNGVVAGEYLIIDQAAFPVRTEITGYPEARSKQVVKLGETASFKVGIYRKGKNVSWSIGVIPMDGGLPMGSAWGGNPEAEGKVLYMNTSRGALYNGPNIIYSVSPASQDSSEPQAFFGKSGWEGLHDFKFNWSGDFFHCEEGDVIEIMVDLVDEGRIRFARNGRLQPHSIENAVQLLGLNDLGEDARPKVSFADEEPPDDAEEASEEENRRGVRLAVQMSQVGDVARLYHASKQNFLTPPPPEPEPEPAEEEPEPEPDPRARRRSRSGSLLLQGRKSSTAETPGGVARRGSVRGGHGSPEGAPGAGRQRSGSVKGLGREGSVKGLGKEGSAKGLAASGSRKSIARTPSNRSQKK